MTLLHNNLTHFIGLGIAIIRVYLIACYPARTRL